LRRIVPPHFDRFHRSIDRIEIPRNFYDARYVYRSSSLSFYVGGPGKFEAFLGRDVKEEGTEKGFAPAPIKKRLRLASFSAPQAQDSRQIE
jgi:hypothetical protein